MIHATIIVIDQCEIVSGSYFSGGGRSDIAAASSFDVGGLSFSNDIPGCPSAETVRKSKTTRRADADQLFAGRRPSRVERDLSWWHTASTPHLPLKLQLVDPRGPRVRSIRCRI